MHPKPSRKSTLAPTLTIEFNAISLIDDWEMDIHVMDDIPNMIANIIINEVHPRTSTFHSLYIHNLVRNLPKKIPCIITKIGYFD